MARKKMWILHEKPATKLYEYGDLVVIRGDPYHKCRCAVRVYSEYTSGNDRIICVLLPSGTGVGVNSEFVRKAKRDTPAKKQSWIDKELRRLRKG